ncbi:exopolysaccharide biosynthesis protein [Pseudoprimorskyibacter insulae]|uniref:Exopolysaccharide synthesis, ExoD n=1 Tax=Pseudoprimorskyibacter insulae TaxID=1695997 RepID=A0A2R8AV01_9RHOB|nr:exopolysaccharide biosynthesis protein [Pseudoprimorskyibacter insulae]SPF79714.1 hypothetical protein PRI8871_01511 [Pseudoprimorskyibacter insulae]
MAPESLEDLLDAMEPEVGDAAVSVRDILERIGDRSFSPAILIPALLLVSPLSGIPGTPTLGAFIIILIALQGAAGRKHLWLPRFLMRRSVSSVRMLRAVDFLERPAKWVDGYTEGRRLIFLTVGPLRILALLMIAVVAATWPFLELLPMVTSIGAGCVSLIAFGLMTRDGVFVLAGYALLALFYGAGFGMIAEWMA